MCFFRTSLESCRKKPNQFLLLAFIGSRPANQYSKKQTNKQAQSPSLLLLANKSFWQIHDYSLQAQFCLFICVSCKRRFFMLFFRQSLKIRISKTEMKYWTSIRPFAYSITLQNMLILQVLYSNFHPHTKWFPDCMFKTLIRKSRGGIDNKELKQLFVRKFE